MRTVGLVAVAMCGLAEPACAAERRPPLPSQAPAATAPVPVDFDLAAHPRARSGEPVASEDAMAPAPRVPRAMVLRGNAPSVEMQPFDDGPVLGAGALGRNGRDVPGLAHVRLDWEF
ncbi:hypothetical protein [Qipengyuania sp. MTN3-11]|uniref:hypothetical protein n=1 Tax=Qipengyuania sp. MTN3-11 TaxID=3056557 RepID=UPI0036F3FCD9